MIENKACQIKIILKRYLETETKLRTFQIPKQTFVLENIREVKTFLNRHYISNKKIHIFNGNS